jgi:hypothetical protein
MNEIHRVLRPGGVLHVLAPCSGCVNALADPTHVRLFNPQTFKYFCIGRPGIRLFRPGCVSGDQWNVYADLWPVHEGEQPATEEELAWFFD